MSDQNQGSGPTYTQGFTPHPNVQQMQDQLGTGGSLPGLDQALNEIRQGIGGTDPGIQNAALHISQALTAITQNMDPLLAATAIGQGIAGWSAKQPWLFGLAAMHAWTHLWMQQGLSGLSSFHQVETEGAQELELAGTGGGGLTGGSMSYGGQGQGATFGQGGAGAYQQGSETIIGADGNRTTGPTGGGSGAL
jgi:hypothetical protein